MAKKQMIELVGNVGGEPEINTIPGKEVTALVYDAIIDDKVERTWTSDPQEVRNFSLAVNGEDADGNELPTRWFRCSDWDAHSAKVHKGQIIKVRGFLRIREVETDDGETKRYRNFTVKELIILARPTAPEQP